MSKLKLARLIIVFIAIIITAFYAFKYAINRIQSSNNEDIVTNMLIIQGKIKVINGDVKVGNSEKQLIGTKISDVQDENIRNTVKNIGITEDSFQEYYTLNRENFETMQISDDLKNVNDGEYVVNYKECEVIYIKGINKDGTVKYKLSDILNKEDDEK